MDTSWITCLILVFVCFGHATSSPAKNRGSSKTGKGSSSSSNYSGGSAANAQPNFISRGQTFRAVAGDTLVLPCEVENLGDYVVLWRRGTAVLTAANLLVTRDNRFRLVDGFNLQVAGVAPTDAGDYVCQISEAGKDQVHTVEILVPPSIRPSPPNGQLRARKGGSITLECKASGNPVPSIRWSRKDSQLKPDKAVEGFSITLDKVDRHQAGVYQCTASNGVGEPVTIDMQLDVEYPPEIEVERSWVHSGEGYEASLVCIVHGEPAPKVEWFQDETSVKPSSRRYLETRGNKHTLTIRTVQEEDFGNYSCVAENLLGKARKYMELSGRPSAAEFRSASEGPFPYSYNITWVIESYAHLKQLHLSYRKISTNENQTNPWQRVDLRPNNGESFKRTMSYHIQSLEPNTEYEAEVVSENRYGRSRVSPEFKFMTRNNEVVINDLGLLARSNTSGGALLPVISSWPVLVLLAMAASHRSKH